MFTALYFKEWKEKALLFFFELGILALLILAPFVLREKKDIQEWLIYAVLMLFYPFAALILGAAGFEAEYRQGAWAYLFSRPVGKPVIWLAKFSALLSMLAALWVVFLALWAVLPGIKELAGAPRILLGYSVESGFPWWSLGQSVFLLTVAFSLSLLHERQFNILFLSLIAGLLFPAAAWALLNSKAGGFLAWISPVRALPVFIISQVLTALALAGASLLTLARSDFSQPRRQMLGFVRSFLPLLLLALAGTAGWALLAPAGGERFLSLAEISAGEPYYVTERGVFRYFTAKDRIQWLAKSRPAHYFVATAAAGKIAYTSFDVNSRDDITEELWVANANERGRTRIIGGGPKGNIWPREAPIADLMMSPDGTRIAILSFGSWSNWRRLQQKPPLWIINSDGTGFENLPDDPSLFGDSAGRQSLHLVAWARGGRALLLGKRTYAKPMTSSLWLYDLDRRTARKVLDDAVMASWLSPASPRGDRLVIRRLKSPGGRWTLALLDLETLETADLAAPEETGRIWSQASWDPKGERLAFMVRKAQPAGGDVYVLVAYSPSEDKLVAEHVLTKNESSAQLASASWASEGQRLIVLDRDGNGLRVFDRELREVDRIAFPAWLTVPAGLAAVGDKALIEDDKTDSLWRFDLGKKSWKKLY